MKVVLPTPTELVVHEGALQTAFLGTMFVAMGGGAIALRLAVSPGWTGNAALWLVYFVGGLFELERLRSAGFGDEEIVEIIALVGPNVFRNYCNVIAGTEVDFPPGSRRDREKHRRA